MTYNLPTDHLAPLLTDWRPPPRPGPEVIPGRYVRLERLDPARDADAIFAATQHDPSIWDYMSNGPFTDAAALRAWMEQAVASDAVFYAFLPAEGGQAFGYASFMRIDAGNGVVEIGNVVISFMCISYFCVIVAWAIFYMLASMTATFPWETCDNWWWVILLML